MTENENKIIFFIVPIRIRRPDFQESGGTSRFTPDWDADNPNILLTS